MSEFLKWLNTCKDCGKESNDVRFGRCPECLRKYDLKESWENPAKYVKVLMHKDEYKKYYKGAEAYDTAPYDEEYISVYIFEEDMAMAKKYHKEFISQRI